MTVINRKKPTEEMAECLEQFQDKVNELTDSNFLQFTLDMWDPDSPPGKIPSNKNVKINQGIAFPYLDMELYWHNTNLEFRVHLQLNQLLKYLNRDSMYTTAYFKAIPSVVIRRLTSLTSLTNENANKCMDELYPEHAKALE